MKRSECSKFRKEYPVCPKISCQYHLLWERHSRDIKEDTPIDDVIDMLSDMKNSCILDVINANPDGMTLDQIASVLGMTRQRINQIYRYKYKHKRNGQVTIRGISTKLRNGRVECLREFWEGEQDLTDAELLATRHGRGMIDAVKNRN